MLVLSAAYRDRLEAVHVVVSGGRAGSLQGILRLRRGARCGAKSGGAGYDVYLRPSSAFSTLGFFNDPLLNTTLRADSLDLANTVIHELTHNTYYAPGSVPFNESFASFVGRAGGRGAFPVAGRLRSASETVDDRWADDKLLGRSGGRLSHTLDSAFKAHPNDRAARLAVRRFNIQGGATPACGQCWTGAQDIPATTRRGYGSTTPPFWPAGCTVPARAFRRLVGAKRPKSASDDRRRDCCGEVAIRRTHSDRSENARLAAKGRKQSHFAVTDVVNAPLKTLCIDSFCLDRMIGFP